MVLLRKIDQHPRLWPSCRLQDREEALPHASGLYAVLRGRRLLYIGKSVNLHDRWQGEGHHRYGQLRRMGRCRLHWVTLSRRTIDRKERELIERWKPSLNGTEVPDYTRWPLADWPWATIATLGLLAVILLFPATSLDLAQRLTNRLFPAEEQPNADP